MLIGFFLSIVLAASHPFAVQSSNIIEGRVTGPDNRPLQNVVVLLQNETYFELNRAYTDYASRYRFGGIVRGNYYVQVEPGQYPFERQTQRLQVNPISGGPAGVGGSS